MTDIKQCLADPTCTAKVTSRGMCPNHYAAWYNAGGKQLVKHKATKSEGVIARLERRTIYPDYGCYILTGGKRPHGELKYHSKWHPAHRIAYVTLMGPISDELDLDHLCENTRCWKPTHLEPVTPRVNVLRGNGSIAAGHLAKSMPTCVCFDRYAAECPNHGQLHWRPDWRECLEDAARAFRMAA